MCDKTTIDVKHGVQLILSTLPKTKKKKFEDKIISNYFEKYRKKMLLEENNFLYKPLKYYMLGNYDVAYLSIINNFKFSHKSFTTENFNQDDHNAVHSFQNINGFALTDDTKIETIFNEIGKESFFIGIINIKLNNGHLIGEGLTFINSFITLLNKEFGELNFLVSQTLTWFEISLSIFLNDPEELHRTILKLRNLKLKDLEDTKMPNSLYSSFYDNESLLETSLIADTHSFFGLNSLLFENDNSDLIKKFNNQIDNINLNTSIEWHVKPGHIQELLTFLNKNKYLNFLNEGIKYSIVLGKSDLVLRKDELGLKFIYNLLTFFNKEEEEEEASTLFKHIRNIRTFIYYNNNPLENEDNQTRNYISWTKILSNLAIKDETFKDINGILKALMISRQLRYKVLKAFSNYNNGIQDPILFSFYLDFSYFIKNLIKYIFEQSKKSKKSIVRLENIEKSLSAYMNVFQEAHNIRFINGYQYENVSDFDLNTNGSFELLLTSYGTLAYEYGRLFYKNTNTTYSPIILLNDIDTTSNRLSINYSIHHLTTTEFIFATLTKEILNHIEKDSLINEKYNIFIKKTVKVLKKINESYLDDMYKSGLIDFSYLLIDSIRLLITFNADFKLFYYWSWAYNLQNSTLYNSTGMINENRLQLEIMRLVLLKDLFDYKYDITECFSPVFETYWERHIHKIKATSKKLIKNIDKNLFYEICTLIANNHYFKSFSKMDNIDEIDIESFSKYKINTDHFNSLDIKDELLGNRDRFYNTRMNEAEIKGIKPIHVMEKNINTILIKQSNENIVQLDRAWDKGNILSKNKEKYKDIPFAIDQTGGVFFYNSSKAEKYFKFNAINLLEIIDFSYKAKKDIIINLDINANINEN